MKACIAEQWRPNSKMTNSPRWVSETAVRRESWTESCRSVVSRLRAENELRTERWCEWPTYESLLSEAIIPCSDTRSRRAARRQGPRGRQSSKSQGMAARIDCKRSLDWLRSVTTRVYTSPYRCIVRRIIIRFRVVWSHERPKSSIRISMKRDRSSFIDRNRVAGWDVSLTLTKDWQRGLPSIWELITRWRYLEKTLCPSWNSIRRISTNHKCWLKRGRNCC